MSKSSRLADIRSAFNGLGADGLFVTPPIARKLIGSLVRRSEAVPPTGDVGMTPREQEIMSLLSDGLSAHRIATSLGISEGTVNTHIGNIYRKLGVNNRVDAIREGVRQKIITLPD